MRYDRHLSLPDVGEAGQRRLRDARVLVVGVGGLGSPAALYLAAAGVGTIGLVDFDRVDESNLQRQVLYSTSDVGAPKLDAAIARLTAFNPEIHFARHDAPFDAANGLDLASAYDLVLDGTDNFAARYLVNDACVLTKTPNVYGSVSQFEGQAAVFALPGGPCYRCLHPEPPPPGLIANCADAGVLGVLPGIIGLIQATEAIKLIVGIGDPLKGRLLLYDALRMRFREITLARDPECPVCGDRPSIRELVAYDVTCEPNMTDSPSTIDVHELIEWRTKREPHTLIDVRQPDEHARERIEHATLIPLPTLESHLDKLPRDRPIVVHCQSGGRSARATAFLRDKGFDARNLVGGINAWRRHGG